MLSLCESPARVKPLCPCCHGERQLPDPFGGDLPLPCPVCCAKEEVIMHHRDWPAGARVIDTCGREATLLAATWDAWAWVQYDDLGVPVIAKADDLRLLSLPEDHPDDRGCEACDEEVA